MTRSTFARSLRFMFTALALVACSGGSSGGGDEDAGAGAESEADAAASRDSAGGPSGVDAAGGSSGGTGCLPCSASFQCGSLTYSFVGGPNGSCVTAGAYYTCDGRVIDGQGRTTSTWHVTGGDLIICDAGGAGCITCTPK